MGFHHKRTPRVGRKTRGNRKGHGRRFASFLEILRWPSNEIKLHLKARARGLSIHDLSDFVEMKKDQNFAYKVCYAEIPSGPHLIGMLLLTSLVSPREGTVKSSTKLAENPSQQTARCAILTPHVTIRS